jgi:hypothetical protein
MEMGCDQFDWLNEGTMEEERRRDPDRACRFASSTGM